MIIDGPDASTVAWEIWDRGFFPFPLVPGTKRPAVKEYVGHSRKRPEEIREDINTIAPDTNLGMSLPLGTLGIDVDTREGKPGGETLSMLLDQLGPLPETVVSTRRGKPSDNPRDFNGIKLYQLPAWAVHGDNEDLVKMVSILGPGVEIIQYHERHIAIYPTVLDDLPYLWWYPDGTSSFLPPSVEDLPILPDEWVHHLYKSGFVFANGRMANRTTLGDLFIEWETNEEAQKTEKQRIRVPPEVSPGGGAPRQALSRLTAYQNLDADDALAWIRSHLLGWSRPANAFMLRKKAIFDAQFRSGYSRHDTTRNFIWNILRLCAGDDRSAQLGNPGGEEICLYAIHTLIEARDREAGGVDSIVRDECERFFVHGVAKLRADIEAGLLWPSADLYYEEVLDPKWEVFHTDTYPNYLGRDYFPDHDFGMLPFGWT